MAKWKEQSQVETQLTTCGILGNSLNLSNSEFPWDDESDYFSGSKFSKELKTGLLQIPFPGDCHTSVHLSTPEQLQNHLEHELRVDLGPASSRASLAMPRGVPFSPSFPACATPCPSCAPYSPQISHCTGWASPLRTFPTECEDNSCDKGRKHLA